MRISHDTTTVVALLAGATLLISACGGTGSSAGDDDGASPEDVAQAVDEQGMATGVTAEQAQGTCELLSNDDIAEVLGAEPIGQAVEEEGSVGATFPSCTWTLPGPEEGMMAGEDASLQMIVLTPEAYEQRRQDAARASGVAPIDGLGEDAWVQNSGAIVPGLYVLGDGEALGFAQYLVFPQGMDLDEATRQKAIDAQVELARRALENL